MNASIRLLKFFFEFRLYIYYLLHTEKLLQYHGRVDAEEMADGASLSRQPRLRRKLLGSADVTQTRVGAAWIDSDKISSLSNRC